mmetsp:Transcript_57409/g.103175  ORF Transcript_57409/g.103175 Transcript_57409/m.103175 type:complete len:393 (+) Transcript_57409:146-1324(+)
MNMKKNNNKWPLGHKPHKFIRGSWSLNDLKGARLRDLPTPLYQLPQAHSHHLHDQTLADSPAALTHCEAHALLDRSLGDELARHVQVVPRHGHLRFSTLSSGHRLHLAGDIAGAEVEDWTVARHHRVAAATLVLGGKVNVGLELGVGLGGAWVADYHSTHDLVLLDAAAQHANRVAGRAFVQIRVEHADAGDDRGLRLLTTAQNLDGVALLHDALLDAASSHCASAGDGENILHSQQEGLVGVTCGQLNVGVHRVHELQDLVAPLVLTSLGGRVGLHGLKGLESRTHDEWSVIAREAVLSEHLTSLQLHEFQELFVLHDVHLVHEAHQPGHTHLLGEQDVLAGLGHGSIRGRDHQNSAVHLAGTCDHVLHVISVAWAVHVAVVPTLCLVLDV